MYTSLFRQATDTREAFATIRRIPSGHPEWIPYCESHRLLEEPGAKALAVTLRSCVARGYNPAWEYSRNHCSWYLPWPLAVCLATAQSQSELIELALRAERGQLGDASEWRAAEERWATKGAIISDFSIVPAPGSPFDASIANAGFPAEAISALSMRPREYSYSELRSLLDVVENDGLTGLIKRMSWVVTDIGSQCPDVQETDFKRLSALVRGMGENDPVSLGLYHPRDTDFRVDQIEFYNECGLAQTLWFYPINGENVEAWVGLCEQEFIRGPDRIGLLRLLGRCVASGYVVNRIPPGLLSQRKYSDPRIDLAALLVRLNHGNLRPDEAGDLAAWAAGLLDPLAERDAADLLFRAVESHLVRVAALETFLIALREKLPPAIELGVARCEGLLRRVLRRRPSGLQKPGQLAELRLPNVATAPA